MNAGRKSCFFIAALLCFVGPANKAFAFDFTVKADTVGEAYRVRGRDGLFTFGRTRLIQSLSLYGGHVWAASFKKNRPLRILLNVNLMLDHDFSVTGAELDGSSPSTFIPLLKKTSLGFLRGYLQLTYGRFKQFDFKLGRQTAFDVTGMYAFDGVKAGFTWFGIFASDFAFGFETIPMFNLAVMDFSPQGISWGSRDGLLEDVHPEITQPELRPMIAATSKLLASRSGTLSIGYRRTYTDLDMNRVSHEKLSVGLSMSSVKSPLSASLVCSYDFLWNRVSEVVAKTRLQVAPRWGLDLDLVHYYPVFDSSSIFNVFYFDPFNEVALSTTFGPGADFSFTVGALARQATRPEDDGETSAVSDGGGKLHVVLRSGRFTVTASGRITDGESGTIAGLELSPRVGLLDETLILMLGGGLWYFNDPLRRGHHAISGGGSLSAAWKIYKLIKLTGTINVYNNRISGFGASTFWVLSVRV
ncbi:MAG: hypothetical protein ABIJ56_22535 [Pseudomonadota bacterium]